VRWWWYEAKYVPVWFVAPAVVLDIATSHAKIPPVHPCK